MLRKMSQVAGRWRSKCLYGGDLTRRETTATAPSPDRQEEPPALPSPVACRRRRGPRHRVVAVGSGKGGVGKTVVSSSIALALTETSLSPIIAMDVDLGGANLHAGLGIPRPSFALNQFVLDGAPLEALSEPSGTDGLRYVGGASDIIGVSEFSVSHRERFLMELLGLGDATVILDLGAGSSLFNLDLFCLADQCVLVTTPEPTAVQNAYGFLRAAVYRRMRLFFNGEAGLSEMIDQAMNHRGKGATDTVPELIQRIARYNRSAASQLEAAVNQIQIGLVVNMCTNGEAHKIAESFARLARGYLGVRTDLLGTVAWDKTVRRAICEWRPLIVHYPRAKASRDLRSIANRVLGRFEPRESPAV